MGTCAPGVWEAETGPSGASWQAGRAESASSEFKKETLPQYIRRRAIQEESQWPSLAYTCTHVQMYVNTHACTHTAPTNSRQKIKARLVRRRLCSESHLNTVTSLSPTRSYLPLSSQQPTNPRLACPLVFFLKPQYTCPSVSESNSASFCIWDLEFLSGHHVSVTRGTPRFPVTPQLSFFSLGSIFPVLA